ncbi:Uma2 family endonuclease [Candidatus Roseilinea sp. NK_OTU-006]|uniref:Uma2 family endonuclease n=1 Tax=Candidatus Roseilinea sp. NK_OTU-006 TaxID=2704250 RepID=UPI00145F3B84|nr:Uma2 family endonuclease [Candidatus Roseilinea sp. NK_OTU-006]
MTYAEFLAWAPEGGLTEWVDGEGVQYMPATHVHQRVVNLLIALLLLKPEATGQGVLGAVYAARKGTRQRP